jgi:molybdenum cofactor synthesis domain-containing protein
MLQIEIITIGNEVLLGDVLDTNSHWLCQQLTRMGGRIRRVVQVRDEVEAIAEEVQWSVECGADLVITSGGLGPTDDDITLHSVAVGLVRPLVENGEALAMIEERYGELAQQGRIPSGELTPPRRKMAQLPRGAQALPNPVGTAPAAVIQEESTTILCLPGVPSELRAIFEGPAAPILAERLAGNHYEEWVIVLRGIGESTLAPLLRRVVTAHPEVYVKSRAQDYDPDLGIKLLVTFSTTGSEQEEVEAALQATLADLTSVLDEVGITVERVQ